MSENLNSFEQCVKEMREAQRLYFKTRDKAVLEKAKELERKVDYWLEKKQNVIENEEKLKVLEALIVAAGKILVKEEKSLDGIMTKPIPKEEKDNIMITHSHMKIFSMNICAILTQEAAKAMNISDDEYRQIVHNICDKHKEM